MFVSEALKQGSQTQLSQRASQPAQNTSVCESQNCFKKLFWFWTSSNVKWAMFGNRLRPANCLSKTPVLQCLLSNYVWNLTITQREDDKTNFSLFFVSPSTDFNINEKNRMEIGEHFEAISRNWKEKFELLKISNEVGMEA